DAEDAAGRLAEVRAERVRILPQPVAGQGGADCLEDARRGRVGVLIGVQLDDAVVARLLAGDVAGHGADVGADERGHGGQEFEGRSEVSSGLSAPMLLPPASLTSTLAAWAVKPSWCASVRTSAATRARPCGV